MKKTTIGILMILCLALFLSAGSAETRMSVIALEGMEEAIEETLYESPLGFSFWYANECLEAYPGEADSIEGVVVAALFSSDHMVLEMITEEEAMACAEEAGADFAELAEASRAQVELYRDLDGTQVRFSCLIAENGQYCRSVGEYALEASEGYAKYFQKVLDSVTLSSGCLIRAEWGGETDEDEDDEDAEETDAAEVILTALEPVTEVWLLRLDWDGAKISWTRETALGGMEAMQSLRVMLTFTGDMPENGIAYTDASGEEHIWALDISGEDGRLILWNPEE